MCNFLYTLLSVDVDYSHYLETRAKYRESIGANVIHTSDVQAFIIFLILAFVIVFLPFIVKKNHLSLILCLFCSLGAFILGHPFYGSIFLLECFWCYFTVKNFIEEKEEDNKRIEKEKHIQSLDFYLCQLSSLYDIKELNAFYIEIIKEKKWIDESNEYLGSYEKSVVEKASTSDIIYNDQLLHIAQRNHSKESITECLKNLRISAPNYEEIKNHLLNL